MLFFSAMLLYIIIIVFTGRNFSIWINDVQMIDKPWKSRTETQGRFRAMFPEDIYLLSTNNTHSALYYISFHKLDLFMFIKHWLILYPSHLKRSKYTKHPNFQDS